MQKVMIDNQYFVGPYILDKDELPHVPGIALAITEAGEGFKIMTVLQGNDIGKTVAESPKRPCWEKHSYHGQVDIYICETDMPESKREDFRINAIAKRKDVIFCDELPRVEDDW